MSYRSDHWQTLYNGAASVSVSAPYPRLYRGGGGGGEERPESVVSCGTSTASELEHCGSQHEPSTRTARKWDNNRCLCVIPVVLFSDLLQKQCGVAFYQSY